MNVRIPGIVKSPPLVTVVVPAFNAAATIEETLQSISQQTYRALEIIVVNDGSTDDTAAIGQRHSRIDRRCRVISKPNGGVASARNAGIVRGGGEFFAFIDADDLWHPTKIEKQVAVLRSAEPDLALVYSPFRLIDPAGKVIASTRTYGINGWVLHRHFHTNFVGNGSALLVRRRVLEEIGGFDPWLRQQDAEGCEDLLLQLRIARRYRFGEVSEYLVGYRKHPGNMTSNADQMIRSGILAVRKALSECGDVQGMMASTLLDRYELQRLRRLVKSGRFGDSLDLFVGRFAAKPGFVAGAVCWYLRALVGKLNLPARSEGVLRLLRPPGGDTSRHFYNYDPKSGMNLERPSAPRALRRLAERDLRYRPELPSAHPRLDWEGSAQAPGTHAQSLTPCKMDRPFLYLRDGPPLPLPKE